MLTRHLVVGYISGANDALYFSQCADWAYVGLCLWTLECRAPVDNSMLQQHSTAATCGACVPLAMEHETKAVPAKMERSGGLDRSGVENSGVKWSEVEWSEVVWDRGPATMHLR